MNILEQIIQKKITEVEDCKKAVPISALEKSIGVLRSTLSLKAAIRRPDRSGIIAEFKRRSPSKGIINGDASVQRVTTGYASAGASALSVLTDQQFFGGSNDDLVEARKHNTCPILRKDFTIDEYQILEARSIGADAILLIAAVLTPERSKRLASFAHSMGMEVLLEVHNEDELRGHLDAGADLIGVNNRNLKDFSVSIDISKQLVPLIPTEVVRVSESGISSPATIVDLERSGFEGFLIGENFMKEQVPEAAALQFMQELQLLRSATYKA